MDIDRKITYSELCIYCGIEEGIRNSLKENLGYEPDSELVRELADI